MKKILTSLLNILFLTTIVYAQNSTGTLKVVIENAEEEEIIGAQVVVFQVEKLMSRAVTDPFGVALISSLNPGYCDIQIRYLGFNSIRNKVVEVKPNDTAMVLASLKPHPLQECWAIRRPLFPGKYGELSSWSTEEILRMPVR